MFLKKSFGQDKYIWTQHSQIKMRQYRLTEARIKRIIRSPARVEEGILENAVACMQPVGGKNYSEIWTMYVVVNEQNLHSSKLSGSKKVSDLLNSLKGRKQLKVITAWRYPGKSPEREPIPAEILREIRNII